MFGRADVENDNLAEQIEKLTREQAAGFLKKWIGNVKEYDRTPDANKIQGAIFIAEVKFKGICLDSSTGESILDSTIKMRDASSGLDQERLNSILQRIQQFYRENAKLNDALKGVKSMVRN